MVTARSCSREQGQSRSLAAASMAAGATGERDAVALERTRHPAGSGCRRRPSPRHQGVVERRALAACSPGRRRTRCRLRYCSDEARDGPDDVLAVGEPARLTCGRVMGLIGCRPPHAPARRFWGSHAAQAACLPSGLSWMVVLLPSTASVPTTPGRPRPGPAGVITRVKALAVPKPTSYCAVGGEPERRPRQGFPRGRACRREKPACGHGRAAPGEPRPSLQLRAGRSRRLQQVRLVVRDDEHAVGLRDIAIWRIRAEPAGRVCPRPLA